MRTTFQALTDAIVTTENQLRYDSYFFAPDMGVHEYVIYGLNHYISIQQHLYHRVVPLAYDTAIMLDVAAKQLVNTYQVRVSPQSSPPRGGIFSQLSRLDRIRTLSSLENLGIDLYLLPSPYQNNAGLVKFVTDALNRFSLFGYYSEWPAYGFTKIYPPDERRLEFFPIGWQQVGYPGVSLGYRDFRGFLITMAEVRETNEQRS